MKTIDELLVEIKEDKKDNLSTTSFQFKRDIWNYFQGFQDKIAVEFGTHKGQTTRILSYLFKKVYTINNNDNDVAKEFNKDRDNIIYLNFDLYSNNQLPISDVIDVFLIDAGHEYEHVINDINRVTSMNCSENCYIIFDDYGANCHLQTVKRAVDQALQMNVLSLIEGIGHVKGYNFGNGNKGGEDRILEDYEGLITKIIWHGGWAIQESCFNLIRQILPEGKTILELGSGQGTNYLSRYYTMYSIENYKEWVNKYKSTYIYAPIKLYDNEWTTPDLPGEGSPKQTGWYDPEIVKNNLPTHYDLILIDGPNGKFGRGGFLKHLDWFNTNVPMIFDDINREADRQLMIKVSEKIGKPYIELDKYTGYIL